VGGVRAKLPRGRRRKPEGYVQRRVLSHTTERRAAPMQKMDSPRCTATRCLKLLIFGMGRPEEGTGNLERPVPRPLRRRKLQPYHPEANYQIWQLPDRCLNSYLDLRQSGSSTTVPRSRSDILGTRAIEGGLVEITTSETLWLTSKGRRNFSHGGHALGMRRLDVCCDAIPVNLKNESRACVSCTRIFALKCMEPTGQAVRFLSSNSWEATIGECTVMGHNLSP
jgi:hypothetical protein